MLYFKTISKYSPQNKILTILRSPKFLNNAQIYARKVFLECGELFPEQGYIFHGGSIRDGKLFYHTHSRK